MNSDRYCIFNTHITLLKINYDLIFLDSKHNKNYNGCSAIYVFFLENTIWINQGCLKTTFKRCL